MRTGAALWSTHTVSSLTAVAVEHVLRSPRLKDLLRANSDRLAAAYDALTKVLRKHDVKYVPANAGLYVFAQIARGAKSWDEETAAVGRLKEAGVLVSAGRGYHTSDSCMGWARIGFSVPPKVLTEALSRLDAYFSANVN